MTKRQPDHPIDPIFLERRSPRTFDGKPMPETDLLTLIEAARWAPSAYNYQPWRFLYARRGDAHWQAFLDLLVPFNAEWAQHASALIFVLSDTLSQGDEMSEPKPSRSHSFDAGAAWAQLALQAGRLGYQVRGMAGVNYNQAQEALRVPERFRVEIAVAVGRHTEAHSLPEQFHKGAEESLRLPVREIAFAGPFPA